MFVFINNSNKNLYFDYYDKFFQVRYQTFIQELNWNVPHQNGREYDQFDHDKAHYIVLFNEEKKVVGGIRLMPTSSAHMLRDVFSNLVEGCEAPVGESIWELSRLVIQKSSDDMVSLVRYRFQELVYALIQFAILHNVKEYVSVSETRVERLFRMAGFPMRRLGKVVVMDNVNVVATRMVIDPTTIKRVASRYFAFGESLYSSDYSNE